jgi:hypothetical protein
MLTHFSSFRLVLKTRAVTAFSLPRSVGRQSASGERAIMFLTLFNTNGHFLITT